MALWSPSREPGRLKPKAGVGVDATAVVKEDTFTGDTDVAIDRVYDETTDGVTVVERTASIWCVLVGIFPCAVDGVDAGTNAGVVAGLSAGVFIKMPDG